MSSPRVIQLTHEYNCDHLLGKYLEDDAYDLVVDEDVDVYKPLKYGEVQSEQNILLKFRKGVFTDSEITTAYEGLRSAAISTDNRGIAAGTRSGTHQTLPSGKPGGRRWVTQREKAVLEYFAKETEPSLFGDLVQDLYNETPDLPLEGRGGTRAGNICIKGGSIWLVKRAHEVDFDRFFQEMLPKTPRERRLATEEFVSKYVSETTYGEAVYSGVAGSMDRYPRIPFCRQTSFTASYPEKFQMAYPLMHRADGIFHDNLPIRYNGQRLCAENLDPEFRIGTTVYSTITINKSFRTACHRDAGDLCDPSDTPMPRGFSNLTVVSNGKKFEGFYLCFPEYRVAANVQPGDFIMMDAHKIHGNTPVKYAEDGFERLSLVLYFREGLTSCGSFAYETARKDFVYSRIDKAKAFNGVSPGMWNTTEWRDYLILNGLTKEAEEVIIE